MFSEAMRIIDSRWRWISRFYWEWHVVSDPQGQLGAKKGSVSYHDASDLGVGVDEGDMEHLEAVSASPGETREQTGYILTNLLVGIREGVSGSHDVGIAQNSRYFVC